jgi:hypothetical protein
MLDLLSSLCAVTSRPVTTFELAQTYAWSWSSHRAWTGTVTGFMEERKKDNSRIASVRGTEAPRADKLKLPTQSRSGPAQESDLVAQDFF